MKISNPFSASVPQRSVPTASTQPSNKLTGLQQDTVHFSGKRPVQFGGHYTTDNGSTFIDTEVFDVGRWNDEKVKEMERAVNKMYAKALLGQELSDKDADSSILHVLGDEFSGAGMTHVFPKTFESSKFSASSSSESSKSSVPLAISAFNLSLMPGHDPTIIYNQLLDLPGAKEEPELTNLTSERKKWGWPEHRVISILVQLPNGEEHRIPVFVEPGVGLIHAQ